MGALDLRELTVRTDGAVVRRAVLSIAPGELVAVVGDGGESALVRAAAGVVAAAAGTVRVAGEDVTGFAYGDVAARGVALVPAGWAPFGGLTIRENVLVGAHGDTARADGVLRQARLRPDLPASALNAADVRVLAVAVALARRPRVVLVDGLLPDVDPPRYAVALGLLRVARLDGTASVVAERAVALTPRVTPPEAFDPAMFDRVLALRGGVLRPWRAVDTEGAY